MALPLHARDFTMATVSTALGLALQFFEYSPALAKVAFGAAFTAFARGVYDLKQENRAHKLPFFGRFFGVLSSPATVVVVSPDLAPTHSSRL